MPQRGLVSLLLLLLLGLAGAAPLSRQEVTRCLEEALQDKLSQGGPGEGPCTQLFQEDERLTSLLQTLEGLRHQEISKHHLSPEHEAEGEEQEEEEEEEEDFRKKKRDCGEAEGEKRQAQEVREEEEEEEEEEVKAKGKSEIRVLEGRGQPREEDQRKRRGPAQEEAVEAWGWGLEKRGAEKASDEETAQFEEEEKGVRLSGGDHSLWQGAGPAHRPHHPASRPEQEQEEEEEQEHRELERLEQMGDELKRAAEALSKRG